MFYDILRDLFRFNPLFDIGKHPFFQRLQREELNVSTFQILRTVMLFHIAAHHQRHESLIARLIACMFIVVGFSMSAAVTGEPLLFIEKFLIVCALIFVLMNSAAGLSREGWKVIESIQQSAPDFKGRSKPARAAR